MWSFVQRRWADRGLWEWLVYHSLLGGSRKSGEYPTCHRVSRNDEIKCMQFYHTTYIHAYTATTYRPLASSPGSTFVSAASQKSWEGPGDKARVPLALTRIQTLISPIKFCSTGTMKYQVQWSTVRWLVLGQCLCRYRIARNFRGCCFRWSGWICEILTSIFLKWPLSIPCTSI